MPRLGQRHTEEAKRRIGEARRRRWDEAGRMTREQRREYKRRWYHQDRAKNPEKYRAQGRKYTVANTRKVREALRAWKLEQGCARCGYRENADALEMDHIERRKDNPDQKVAATVSSWAALERAKAECQVLCANCHRIKSNAEIRQDALERRSA